MNFPALLLLAAGLASTLPAADPYTRQPGIDAIHYAFQLALNDRTDQIEGTSTVAIRFVQHGTTSFWLDLASQADGKGMTVTDVTSAGVPVRFEHRGDRLQMMLASAPAVNAEQSFVIRYRGVPDSGLFIGRNKFGELWSPRGDEIALSVGRYFCQPGPPLGQIALMKPDGSDFRLIVDDSLNNGFPSWSPDGTRLVFKRGHQLVTMALADRKIVPLTDGSHFDNFPQWSPKGDLILFTSDRADGDFERYVIRSDGSGLRRLTNANGNDAHGSWCAGGNWILFSSGRMGFKDEMALYDNLPQPYGEIFAMCADGSDVHQLTDNKWEDSSASCRH
jgi:hypothetical protein